MNFKGATDVLFDNLTHSDLAEALGVSIATIRQARLKASALSHRSPPSDWKHVVIRLAERRIMHYRRLIDNLRAQEDVS